ncbi:MAG TPA: hypothetical protein PK468_09630 [Candidatus Hydrogenedentes bacterium]|nr:hypothetical protein [Candidatus Hydrogenedentota bacterium]
MITGVVCAFIVGLSVGHILTKQAIAYARPGLAFCQLAFATRCLEAGEEAKAISFLFESVFFDPGSYEARVALADVCRKMGYLELALYQTEDAERVMALQPDQESEPLLRSKRYLDTTKEAVLASLSNAQAKAEERQGEDP